MSDLREKMAAVIDPYVLGYCNAYELCETDEEVRTEALASILDLVAEDRRELIEALKTQMGNLGELRRQIEVENRPHLLRIIDRWSADINAALAEEEGK